MYVCMAQGYLLLPTTTHMEARPEGDLISKTWGWGQLERYK